MHGSPEYARNLEGIAERAAFAKRKPEPDRALARIRELLKNGISGPDALLHICRYAGISKVNA